VTGVSHRKTLFMLLFFFFFEKRRHTERLRNRFCDYDVTVIAIIPLRHFFFVSAKQDKNIFVRILFSPICKIFHKHFSRFNIGEKRADLRNIFCAQLTIPRSPRYHCYFHEKKARRNEGGDGWLSVIR